MTVTLILAAALAVDFGNETGKIRPELHSSGFGPTICSQTVQDLEDVKSMGFAYARTHDWALVNPNERVCDWHHIFPLKDLDATKPENYVFGPTDYLLKRTREEAGLKVFFRLGTSIEHSGKKIHFNSAIPEDFDKVAEVFAATVRHYNRGWANGYKWGIKYWEIWNEPDGHNNMWCLPEGDGESAEWAQLDPKRRDLFVKFFVKVLKRLKSEFPELKVGGPALCTMREDWFRPILKACKAEGVAPDFLSWHYYGNDPDRMFEMVEQADRICIEEGFPKMEMIINEWHFISKAGWGQVVRLRGPGTVNDIDSACYTLTVLSRLQTSRYDQAYFYGCRHTGNWGYRDYYTGDPNKNFFALKAFGEIKRDCTEICASASGDKAVTAFAAAGADGKNRTLLVTDYCGRDSRIAVTAKGLDGVKKAKVRVLSYERDLEPRTVDVKDGRFTLVKPDAYSAAFLVTFDR